MQLAFKAFANRTLQSRNVKSPNWRFWRQRKRTTINLINYHWWLGKYMWKCLTIFFFFNFIEKFRVLTQDDHMRKKRTTEERCCQGVRGCRIPQSLQSAEVLSGQIPCTKTCLRTELGLPALLPLSAMYTMKFWLRLKQPVSWLQSEVAFTIRKEDRCLF